jgi:hypothetical protein
VSSSRPTSVDDDRGSATSEPSPAELLRQKRGATAMRTEAACCGAAGCRETERLWRIVVGDEIRILCRPDAVEYARRQQ